ncbi:hydroxyacid dehydrogenase [Aquibium oceanicum]|uniref:Dehydrogenase n=1 Tax=Aquibium oceanicum TaxID=1670800 RepID=A0A1L3SL83_9HYPH|nr:hydroxyacid dehydrogenase [Aquibium oceanicum]APH70130.1 dehydrogenase [Aquibium oceanicum]
MTGPASPPTIFSTNDIHPRAVEHLASAAEFVVASSPTREAILAEAGSADVIIVRAPLPPELFDAAPRLRAAVRHGAGLDMIPIEEATRAGVLVANVPAVNAPTVAEHVVMAILALLRRFRMVDRDLRGDGWFAGRSHADHGHDLSGRRLGIVGMGNVGRAVHRMAQGFGLSVTATTRTPGNLPDGVASADLETLLETSDVVVLCCPLTPQTRGLISRERIARMKPGALLVNVSRGAVVDEAALIETLRNGHLGGAALDVFSDQPLDPQSPLFSFDNVILTPHMAGITEESMQRMGEGAAREALRVLSGELPENLRNPEAVARYRERFPAG